MKHKRSTVYKQLFLLYCLGAHRSEAMNFVKHPIVTVTNWWNKKTPVIDNITNSMEEGTTTNNSLEITNLIEEPSQENTENNIPKLQLVGNEEPLRQENNQLQNPASGNNPQQRENKSRKERQISVSQPANNHTNNELQPNSSNALVPVNNDTNDSPVNKEKKVHNIWHIFHILKNNKFNFSWEIVKILRTIFAYSQCFTSIIFFMFAGVFSPILNYLSTLSKNDFKKENESTIKIIVGQIITLIKRNITAEWVLDNNQYFLQVIIVIIVIIGVGYQTDPSLLTIIFDYFRLGLPLYFAKDIGTHLIKPIKLYEAIENNDDKSLEEFKKSFAIENETNQTNEKSEKNQDTKSEDKKEKTKINEKSTTNKEKQAHKEETPKNNEKKEEIPEEEKNNIEIDELNEKINEFKKNNDGKTELLQNIDTIEKTEFKKKEEDLKKSIKESEDKLKNTKDVHEKKEINTKLKEEKEKLENLTDENKKEFLIKKIEVLSSIKEENLSEKDKKKLKELRKELEILNDKNKPIVPVSGEKNKKTFSVKFSLGLLALIGAGIYFFNNSKLEEVN